MIHICHSAARQMLRQQRKAAARSALLTLLILTAGASAAFHISAATLHHEHYTPLTGATFLHSHDTAPADQPKHPDTTRKAICSPPTLLLDTAFIPEAETEQTNCELELPVPPPEETELLETDAEMLLHAPRQNTPPPARETAPPREAENYTPPAYRHCPPPPRPAALRLQLRELIVGVLIEVDAEGTPRKVSITHPSGSRPLDQHTRSWILRNWKFTPASRHGRAVDAKVSTELRYALAN